MSNFFFAHFWHIWSEGGSGKKGVFWGLQLKLSTYRGSNFFRSFDCKDTSPPLYCQISLVGRMAPEGRAAHLPSQMMPKNAHIFGLFPYISLYLYRQKNENLWKITLNVSKMYKHALLGQIAPENYDLSIYFNFLSNLKCHFYIHIFILAAKPLPLLDIWWLETDRCPVSEHPI